jgi:hypothetical protein
MNQPSLAPSLVMTAVGGLVFLWAVLHPGSSMAVMLFWTGLVVAVLGVAMFMKTCNTNTTIR